MNCDCNTDENCEKCERENVIRPKNLEIECSTIKEENTLSGWFDVIKHMGIDAQKKEQELRDKLKVRKHFVYHDPYLDIDIWLWKGEQCVVEAVVRNGKIDVHSIQHHSIGYILALNEVREWH
jgi:hypothetical protein